MARLVLAAAFATALALGGSSRLVSAAELSPAPAGWPPDGTSTYRGTWTVVDLVSDDGMGVSQYEVGDAFPGSIEVVCAGAQASRCDFRATFWESTLVRDADGTFRSVEERRMDAGGCGGPGTVARTEIAAVFDTSSAMVTIAELHVPRTYTNDGCSSWATDEYWRFEGELEAAPPSPSGVLAVDLDAYLDGYGLECAPDPAGRTCRMELPDAIYEVVTRSDADDAVTAIDASVTSLDESMPSDAGAFLRGVAERSPVEDAAALLTWFDAAIAGDDAGFTEDGWTASWSDTATEGGRVWALSVLRDLAPEASPTVAPPPAAPTQVPAPTAGAGAVIGGDPPTEPQSFAGSVPAPAEISTSPAVVLQSALLAALLVFLMPFPSQLFNSTLETHEAEVRRWLRLDRLGAAARGFAGFWASWPGVVVFTALAALLYGFLDPSFGLDQQSIATFLGMLLGIVLVTVAFAVPTVLSHRRHGDRPTLAVVPVSLLIGVICVLISRITSFQPGYLYGLLIGLAFARELSAAEEGRATAVGAALMLAVAFIAWLALGGLPDGEGFGLAVLRTALAALMVAGLEGVVFGLLPMRFLPGEALYSWNRVLWGSLLLVGGFAFFHILINPASGYLSDTSRTPLFTVIGLLLGFSVVSVAFWGWFRFRTERTGAPHQNQEGAS